MGAVHEASHGSRRHLQRLGKNTLSAPAVWIERGQAMSSEAESAQANMALVVESVEAFNAGGTERLLSVMAADFVMHLADFPAPLGRDAWREGFEMLMRAFPDLEARIDDVVAADDKVALRLTPPRHPPRRVPRNPHHRPHDPVPQPRVPPH